MTPGPGGGAQGTFDPFAACAMDWNAVAGRPPFTVNWGAVRERVGGRSVLITGAGGSLGRPLAQAIAEAGPARLTLFDHHESSLFRLRESLLGAHPTLPLRAKLGDVREQRRLQRTIQEAQPHVVFHLAAYKHVPWGEEDAEAFAAANVVGAKNVLEAAHAAGAEQIVYPSTDKAIDPPSLYGATKRVVEGILLAACADGGPRATIVRFVNVLGSQGSAPETFARQILQGQPVTLTHQEMRRFWITPAHACLLLLHAACVQERCAVVVPDAGDEIAAEEIARRVFQQLHVDGSGPKVVVTGLRPGERLSEPLVAPHERAEPGPLPGLLLVRGGRVPSRTEVDRAVAEIERTLQDEGGDAVRAAVFDAARSF